MFDVLRAYVLRADPIPVILAAVLLLMLGVLVIAVPALVAWLFGIACILAAAAVLSARFVHAQR